LLTVFQFSSYANCESYRRAIEDFEEAVRLNPSHSNAKKYLHQTLTAFAYKLVFFFRVICASDQ